MDITLYSIGCPKCTVLKRKMDNKKISYNYINSLDAVIERNFQEVPQLEIDGKVFSFNDARKLVDGFDNSTSFEEYYLKKAE